MKKKFMKKTIAALAAAGMVCASLAACGSTQTTESAASTSKAEATDASVSTETASKAGSDSVSGSVSTNGSTSMEKVIGTLSEQFMNDHSDVTITYDATGSGTGIEAVSNGTCDIGLASRDLKDEEKEKGLKQTTIAIDGIAIIVNADNPVDNLSLDQLSAIYKGETSNWSDAGGSDLEIACIGREAGSGTRDGFETVTDTADQCVLSQELTSTGAVIESVKNSPNAIGYASYSEAEGQDGIKLLSIDDVSCSEDTILDGTYKVQRNFNLITKEDTDLSAAAEAFFEYMTSADAAPLIEQAGVVPTVEEK